MTNMSTHEDQGLEACLARLETTYFSGCIDDITVILHSVHRLTLEQLRRLFSISCVKSMVEEAISKIRGVSNFGEEYKNEPIA